MNNSELKALTTSLIALCQNYDLLPTESGPLADELQSIVANETYISKQELIYFIENN